MAAKLIMSIIWNKLESGAKSNTFVQSARVESSQVELSWIEPSQAKLIVWLAAKLDDRWNPLGTQSKRDQQQQANISLRTFGSFARLFNWLAVQRTKLDSNQIGRQQMQAKQSTRVGNPFCFLDWLPFGLRAQKLRPSAKKGPAKSNANSSSRIIICAH